NHDTGSAISAYRAGCHGPPGAANLTTAPHAPEDDVPLQMAAFKIDHRGLSPLRGAREPYTRPSRAKSCDRTPLQLALHLQLSGLVNGVNMENGLGGIQADH